MDDFVYWPAVYRDLAQLILDSGDKVVDQRGNDTIEVINAHIVIPDPRNRIILDPARKMNLPFAYSEFLAMLIGDGSLPTFRQFIHTYDRFSSDGVSIDGAYGHRIERLCGKETNQIDAIIEILKKDSSTRRAVIQLYDWRDLWGMGGKNTPCTLTIQFLIRHGRLDMIVNMRSNDLWLGFTYDMFNFSMLQEYVAEMTKVQLGTYYHNAGSLHIYEKDIDTIMSMRENGVSIPMLPMTLMAAEEMKDVANAYRLMGQNVDIVNSFSTGYARDMINAAKAFKNKADYKMFNQYAGFIRDLAVAVSMDNWAPNV